MKRIGRIHKNYERTHSKKAVGRPPKQKPPNLLVMPPSTPPCLPSSTSATIPPLPSATIPPLPSSTSATIPPCYSATVRTSNCEILTSVTKCKHCMEYRATLHTLCNRSSLRSSATFSSHTNDRYVNKL